MQALGHVLLLATTRPAIRLGVTPPRLLASINLADRRRGVRLLSSILHISGGNTAALLVLDEARAFLALLPQGLRAVH
jgi:hypothetical protein